MINNLDPLSAIFNGTDPRVNSQLRQRIALAMLTKQRKAPKTFGEGLSAIGDSLGEIGTMRRLEQGDLADQAADRRLDPSALPGTAAADAPAPTQTAYAPPVDVPQDAAPTAAEAPADLLTTAPGQPASILGGSTPAGLGGTTQAPLSPTQSASLMNPNPTRTAIAAQLAGKPAAQGGYNMIDAQAGMPRQGQGRVQDALEAAYPGNPDMQAYGSQLAAGEQQRPGEVSSTGARGPWQFVPGTAQQYGLSNPDDPMAAAEALKGFTADNAATFAAKNGRPPTMAELAVMHQQGGATGAGMVAGTTNASPRNLALNNVPPGASPAAAVEKIKGYYGLPDRAVDAGGGGDARQAIAQAMAPQAPVMAFDGQPRPQAPQPPQPQQQIRQAPPPGAQPAAIPGYVPPEPGPEPQSPAQMPKNRAELIAEQQFNEARRSGNTYTMERTAKVLASEAEKRQYIDARNLEVYKDKLKQRAEANKEREAARVTQTSRINDAQKAEAELVGKQTEARIIQRSGMEPKELYKRLDEEKSSVDLAIKAQSAQALARKAIRDGVITGYGANMRIAAAKFADWGLKNGLGGDLAANTEIMKAAMDMGLSEAVKTVNGEGGTGVSNADVNIARGLSGSDPNLQMKTIQTIMDRAAEINFRKINRYEDYIDRTLSGEPSELKYRSSHGPTAPGEHIKMLMDAQADPAKGPQIRAYFDKTYGPGAAELELARVERLARRRARGG